MLRGFSRKQGILLLQHRSASSSRLSVKSEPDLRNTHLHALKPGQPSPGQHSLLRPPFAVTPITRNINLFPSTTPFRPRARGRLTLPRLTLDPGTAVFRRAGFSPAFIVTYVSIRTSIPPACLTTHLHRLTETLPTQQRISVAAATSVHGLARYIFRAGRLDQ